MIRSFGNKAEQIWTEEFVKRIDRNVQRSVMRKLEPLHAAVDLEDLRLPPDNRLEPLKAIAGVSTASGSMNSGVSASCGATAVSMTSNLWTITEVTSE